MEGAPHDSRCYACLTPAAPRILANDALPGLCAECRRGSRTVRERLSRLFGDRFSAVYFDQPRVDPPVPKVQSRCACCGMAGTSFGWTCWRDVAADGEPGCASVEGDAYAFCVNCEALSADPWRQTASSSAPGPSSGRIGSARALSRTSSFLVAELIGLFFVSIAILALLM